MKPKEPWRPLSTDESSLLLFLLEHESDKLHLLLPQIQGLLARSGCDCGCPTIEFLVNVEIEPAFSDLRVITDDVYGHSDSRLVGTFLIIDDGKLSEMEIYDVSGQISGAYGLPDISTLTRNTSRPMLQPK
jgi:hypothetical protein